MYENKKKSGFATAALVLGIIGLCTSFIPIINNLSFFLCVIGIIFAIISLIKKASKSKAIISAILCILAIIITLSMQQSLSESLDAVSKDLDKATGNATEEILSNDADVVFGEFSSTEDEYGFIETELPVTVTNKTQETKSFSIQIEAINPDGSRITTDYIYANNLTAGQNQTFKAFEFVSSDDLEAIKNATFKIVEISMN